MSDPDDLEHFRQSMGDVKPIKSDKRVSLNKKAPTHEALQARREAAEALSSEQEDLLSGNYVGKLEPSAILEFQRPGIQHGVYKNLRLGKYKIEARLDLHGHTVDQARVELYAFIKDCQQMDIRCAMITHGKGEGRKEPALLKSCVNHWLPQLEAVLAFHSAQQNDGGRGATYVLLRKSEKKRLENL